MILFIALVGTSSFAQNGLKFERTSAMQIFDQSSFFSPPKDDIDGSVNLYKEWNSIAFIYTKDGDQMILRDVNFNIKEDVFQTHMSKDSIFSFRINNFDRLEMNNKVYKNVYGNGKNKVYEVLFESDNLSLYKGYEVEIMAANNDPFVGRTKSKYSQKANYFVMQSYNLTLFKSCFYNL